MVKNTIARSQSYKHQETLTITEVTNNNTTTFANCPCNYTCCHYNLFFNDGDDDNNNDIIIIIIIPYRLSLRQDNNSETKTHL